MARQMFETDEDRENELRIITKLCDACNLTFKKLPCPPYKMDYLLFQPNGVAKAWAEVKARNQTYDPMYASVDKWQSLMAIKEATGVGSIWVMGLPDGRVGYVPVGPETIMGVSWVVDPRDREEKDAEPCVMIPLKHFMWI